MHPFWEPVIAPFFEIVKPAVIVEIGADEGINTARILEYCKKNKAHAHIIEPFPKYDPEYFHQKYGTVFTHHSELSLNALPHTGPMDAVLIDGDHNWYTVFNELKLIEKICRDHHKNMPLIFVHDICWPYARRDMYYNPDNIPEEFRQPFAKKGLFAGNAQLADKGGFNSHLCNAISEGTPKNGVLTAVEDFLAENEKQMGFVKLSVIHGLGILFPASFLTDVPGFADFTDGLQPLGHLKSMLEAFEKDRITQIVDMEDQKAGLETRSREYRQAIRDLENLLREKEGLFRQQLQTLEKRIRDLESALNKKDSDLNKKDFDLREMHAQRDQLHSFMMQIGHRFDGLVRSRRWRLGNSLMNSASRILMKKPPATPVDHIQAVFDRYLAFRRDPKALITGGSTYGFPQAGGNGPVLAKKKPYNFTIAVISWDVGHNPLGRAYMLAEALERYFHVILLGPSFPRYNTGIWEPLENSSIMPIPLPGKNFPEFLDVLQTAAPRIKADVIIACKPRLPSVQLGLMMKAFSNRPMFVDIDDFELSFFNSKTSLSADDLKKWTGSKDLALPFGETWTRFAQSLVGLADGIFVSNPVLKKKFGGVEVPHARDETRFDPGRWDRNARRHALGFCARDRVVLFLGTPRPHKGVFEVLQAIKACNNKDYKLCVIGTPPDRSYENKLRKAGGDSLVMVPNQPFENLPENLAAADLVCLLQDKDSDISNYQLPAKVIDAIAMAVPVLATPTAPLAPLVEAGLVMPVSPEDLSEKIDEVLSRPEHYRQLQLSGRQLFLGKYSYAAISATMKDAILEALKDPGPLPEGALGFTEYQKVLAPEKKRTDKNKSMKAAKGIDLVMFWKQNDTGIYGRRIDMLIKHMALRPEVRRVIVFDMPMAAWQLRQKAFSTGIVHDRLVYRETLLKNWGMRDTDKVSYNTFLYEDHKEDRKSLFGTGPDSGTYMNYIAGMLREAGIEPDSAVFWFYPQNRYISKIAAHFRPGLSVVDIVDDHRTWPGLSELRKLYITRHYKEVLALADVVMTNCQSICESMSDLHSEIMLVPNACDVEPAPDLSGDKAFEAFKAMPGPKIGYVGNLEKAKFDADLIEYIAGIHPEWQIVLIGSAHANPDVLALNRYDNIHFMGIVTYPQIRAWIREFDVAVMPHLDSPQTRSMNPLKLYVYCAMNVPVVTTDVANIDEFRSYVSVARSRSEFAEAIEKAIEGPPGENNPDMEQCLAENTWDKRVEIIIRAISARTPWACRSHS